FFFITTRVASTVDQAAEPKARRQGMSTIRRHHRNLVYFFSFNIFFLSFGDAFACFPFISSSFWNLDLSLSSCIFLSDASSSHFWRCNKDSL
ncbi:hypothetical protein PMAYCL1PPCAC_19359, partial [Pristionchus mayeri]